MSNESVTSDFFINASLRSANEQFQAYSGYILIRSESNSITDLIEAGRLLERVWLKCTQHEIAVHPMSQVLEEKEYYELLKKSLAINDEIQMLLRIGKVKEYPKRTIRRLTVEDILIK
jgi:hypothetical protein